MCLCVTLIIATVAAINISIPKIEESELHPTSTQLLWIVDLYVVVFAGLLFPSGAIGDKYGRKTGLVCGLAAFTIASVLAALAKKIWLFFLARIIMGMGAAFIMPITLAVITFVFKGARRERAISVWAACTALGGGVGLMAGGLVSQFLTWNYVFFLGAAIGLLALILSAIFVPKTPAYDRVIDVRGSLLLVICFVSLLFGIIEAPEMGWISLLVIVAFAVSASAITTFILSSIGRKDALFDPRVFKDKALRSGAFGIAMSFFAMFSLYFVNAQFLQYAKGYSPLLTGLAILPATITIFTFSRLSSWFTQWLGVRTVLAGGIACVAAGLFFISLCGPDTPYLVYAAALVVTAIGPGLSNPTLSDAIMNSFEEKQAGIGSAINDTTREVGSALGVAVMGTFIAKQFPKGIPKETLRLVGMKLARGSVGDVIAKVQRAHLNKDMPAIREAFAQAIHTGYRFSALTVLLEAVVIWYWYPTRRR